MIDTTAFVAAGHPSEPLEFVARIGASPDVVFHALTASDAVTEWLGVTSRIELRVGGPYEFYFDANLEPGTRGSEGCQILAYVPGEMLAFSWNSPPTETLLQIRDLRSWVVYTLQPDGDGGTDVRLVHTGMGDGELWDANRAYFRRAWPTVLDALHRHFADG
jgi:uncharacterized protein YndB with AHSA1/START domain